MNDSSPALFRREPHAPDSAWALPRMTKRIVLFAIGFTLGGLLYVIGADTSSPAAPACPHCAVLSPAIHDPQCDEAVQGGWICEGR